MFFLALWTRLLDCSFEIFRKHGSSATLAGSRGFRAFGVKEARGAANVDPLRT